jgi:hypothetical protein
MTESYVITPALIPSSGPTRVLVKYSNSELTSNTEYALIQNSNKFRLANTKFTTSFTSFTGRYGISSIASDNKGRIYVSYNNNLTIYYDDGTYISNTNQPYTYKGSSAGPDDDTIYWGGEGIFGIYSISQNSFTTNKGTSANIWSLVYNPNDGQTYITVYVQGNYNKVSIYTINSEGETSLFFDGSNNIPTANSNDFFEGITIGPNNNFYCVVRQTAEVYRISSDGTSCEKLTRLSSAEGAGIRYIPSLNRFYVQTTNGKIFSMDLSGNYESVDVTVRPAAWGNYYNPSTNIYYSTNILTNNSTINKYYINEKRTIFFDFQYLYLSTNVSTANVYIYILVLHLLPLLPMLETPYILIKSERHQPYQN